MAMRGRIIKLLIFVFVPCAFVWMLLSPGSARRDVTVTWKACVQHANALLSQEREQFQTNVEEEIESRVQAALAEKSSKPVDGTHWLTTTTRRDDLRHDEGRVVPTVKRPETKTYEGNVANILRQSHRPRFRGAAPSYNPLTEDGYVRNCITGQPLWLVDRDSLLGDISLLPDESDETASQRKSSFDKIYGEQRWGNRWGEGGLQESSLSGRGSSLRWSQEMSATLHTVINWLKIHLKKSRISLLDLPCGDMTWMERFLLTRDDIDYTGVDIVGDLIKRHKERYEPMPWRFLVLDAVNASLPRSHDLVLNRMMLQHLYLPDVLKVLQHFSDSSSGYLLTTTFPRERNNMDLIINKNNPGRFRPLNLELPPISLSPPLCLQRDGVKDEMEGWDHFIGLWKLPLLQDLSCGRAKEGIYPGTDFTVYSCGNIQNI